MKNNKVLFIIIGLVALAVVNTVVFVSVKEFYVARWINIGFLNFSVLISWLFTIMGGKREFKYMNYSRMPVVATYSLITFILSALFIMCNLKNVTVTIVVQVILLGIFVIILATNTMANNSAESSQTEEKRNYNKIADMTTRLDTLLKSINNRDVYKKIEKAYDSVKNAKVAIKEDTTQIDNDIITAIGIIEYNAENANYEAIDEQVDKINKLIIKRNLMN